MLIGCAAAVTLVLGLIKGIAAPRLAYWMFLCMLAQMLPLYLALPWSIKWAKAFRAMPPPSVRCAELRPWRVLDYVSPLRIGLGIFAAGLALICSVLAYLHRPQLLALILALAVFSATLLSRMIYVLFSATGFGRLRADPYMSPADTFRVRQMRFRGLYGAGAVFGALFSVELLYSAQLLRFDVVYLLIGISVLFQLFAMALVLAQSRDLQTRDFSVYREDSAARQTS